MNWRKWAGRTAMGAGVAAAIGAGAMLGEQGAKVIRHNDSVYAAVTPRLDEYERASIAFVNSLKSLDDAYKVKTLHSDVKERFLEEAEDKALRLASLGAQIAEMRGSKAGSVGGRFSFTIISRDTMLQIPALLADASKVYKSTKFSAAGQVIARQLQEYGKMSLDGVGWYLLSPSLSPLNPMNGPRIK
jgi:hypothetical protein